MKILNLYSGIGGNRKLWGNEHEITAIENDEDIAMVYSYFFPKDRVIVANAHEYLLDHYKEFDFIWSSPPCQTHSNIRQNLGVKFRGVKPVYPDMKLYQEILFLQANFEGKWVVENVRPYYKPLINPTVVIKKNMLWSNFDIKPLDIKYGNHRDLNKISDVEKLHGFDLSRFKWLKNKRQVLRNCVYPPVGKHILNQVKE